MAGSGAHRPSLLVEAQAPLIGLIVDEDGHEVVRYFADEALADAAVAAMVDETTSEALDTIGAFSDLDWDELVEELDRIRHTSQPTPPISL